MSGCYRNGCPDVPECAETPQTYQDCCLDEIRKQFGFVAQFLGDGIVAYFGYPIAEENDAERAVLAGLAIVSTIRTVVPPTGRKLGVRIGVATGDVLIGDIVGDASAGIHFALGDIPNLAARIQGAAERGSVAVSNSTHRLLGRNFDCQSAGEQRFKGFSESEEVWVVRGVRRSESRFKARQHGALSPLIGREEEYRLIRNRWADAVRGIGQTVLISGEAGIGKSRLAEALIERTRGTSSIDLIFQCTPYHQASTFYPVISHLTSAMGLTDADDVDTKLEKIRSFLGHRRGVDQAIIAAFQRLLTIDTPEQSDDLSSHEMKEQIVETLLGHMEKLSSDGPVRILFEDLHWIDPSTEELLDRLIERLENARIMLICTYRPDYKARWAGQARVTTLSLSRLDGRYSSKLVQHLLGEQQVSSELMEMISTRAEGVPLFVEEMARTVIERRRRVARGGDPGNELELPSRSRTCCRPRSIICPMSGISFRSAPRWAGVFPRRSSPPCTGRTRGSTATR